MYTRKDNPISKGAINKFIADLSSGCKSFQYSDEAIMKATESIECLMEAVAVIFDEACSKFLKELEK